MKAGIKKAAIIIFWVAVWGAAAVAIDNKILMATPIQTAVRLAELFTEKAFYLSVARSLARIALGFLAGFLAAVCLAAAAARYKFAEELLAPIMHLMKAIPVASFVVILLIWWGASFLSVAICFLVVLPNLYINTLSGLKNTDNELLEMAHVFEMPMWNRFFYIYRPALEPFLCSGMKIALGMCWKSGVAAEVIGIPDLSIGERLYMSKIYLDTAGVFAWTVVIIILSVIFERVVMFVTEKFFAWEPACHRSRGRYACSAHVTGSYHDMPEHNEPEHGTHETPAIRAVSLSKAFDGKTVLENVGVAISKGETCYLTEPSGSGKTTFLRLVAGLLTPDSGNIEVNGRVSMMFQEDRLCDKYSAIKNVELVLGSEALAASALGRLLPEDSLTKPCESLSGGMKRRVALCRAVESDSDILLLDEPFTGLDAATRTAAENYIKDRAGNRTILIVTHV